MPLGTFQCNYDASHGNGIYHEDLCLINCKYFNWTAMASCCTRLIPSSGEFLISFQLREWDSSACANIGFYEFIINSVLEWERDAGRWVSQHWYDEQIYTKLNKECRAQCTMQLSTLIIRTCGTSIAVFCPLIIVMHSLERPRGRLTQWKLREKK
jgi:hypothetical protein